MLHFDFNFRLSSEIKNWPIDPVETNWVILMEKVIDRKIFFKFKEL